MQKQGRAFGHCEASDKVVRDEIFEWQLGVVSNDLSEWLKLKKSQYLALRTNVGNEPKQFT
jgi:hypothetical protein